MVAQTGMTLHKTETGSKPDSKIKIIGPVFFSLLLICSVILLNVNLRTASAAGVCDCASCHGENHHGNDWAACRTCHLSPPQTGAHLMHSADLSNSTYGDTITSTAGEYRFGCGHCHPLDYSRHNNGTKDIELYNPNPVATGRTGEQVCSDCHGSTGPHGTACDSNDCLSCHSIAQGSTPAVVPSVNHHSGTCATCHYAGAADGRAPHDSIKPLRTDDSCKACHGAKPLYYSPAMSNFACVQCHTSTTKAAAFASCTTSACHPTMTNAADVGKDIHMSKPRPNFTATCDTATSYKMNFDATAYPHICPGGYTCTYSWDFGQAGGTTTNANTATPSHTYTSGGTFPVTLTLAAVGGGSASVTKSVTTCTVNQPPACGHTAIVSTPGNIVSFTDTSSDDGVGGPALVSVNWGDTREDLNKPLLSSFSHTYATVGTYMLIQTVKDAKGAISECPHEYVTPIPAGAKFKVTVNMSKAATYAAVKVLLNGVIKSQGSTGATGLTWTSAALPANAGYKLSVTKTGKTFSCNGAAVNLSAGNQTIACTVTP